MEPLSYDSASKCLVTASGVRYPVRTHADHSYIDFLSDRAGTLHGIAQHQRAIYDSNATRNYPKKRQDGASFMHKFLRSRFRGRVKSKEELIYRAMRHCQLSSASRVLEIGCNDGRYLNLCTQMHGCIGVGIDLAEHAIQQAIEVKPPELRTQFHVAEASRLPFATKAFDCIISFDVFEHLGHSGFEQTMKECSRVLTSKGKLIVYIVSQKDEFTLHQTIQRISGGRCGVDNQDGHVFESFIHPDFFRQVAQDSGFTTKDLIAYHGFWTLFAEEFLFNAPPKLAYKLFEALDYALTRYEYGNGFLAICETA